MQFQSVKPDWTTVTIILGSCAWMDFLEGGKQVHAALQKAALHTDNYFASLTFNSLNKEAFLLFKQILRGRILPTKFSYATGLSCCTKLSSLFQGRQIHSQVVKGGYDSDVFVGTALVDMYCKCGDIDEARKHFDMMPVRSIVTWNEMIHGYAQNGRGDEAVCLYEDIIASDQGFRIFNAMRSDHGVAPELDHYTCIDCLGRAGHFLDVELLMEQMPYKDDPVVWEVVLSCCRVHGNVSLAQRAAENSSGSTLRAPHRTHF
ncbi:Haloacid dehalogenase-like hydrolase superfamily protein isoform 1 [Hibiscus syriacus]|uniref:Haloacid dehalogenase-like hydrolase superfamily protein isoform 1 n=1 Tax=Hibiscus syriacus TaxID=106335 RepID=A0A6A2Z3Z3_HIBSY|nr:Haloacid dehalogenase-like hydrolase superfamily protein isoform 1 [Hibiscus syriacus]